ncbi:MAG: hypothetical protein J6A73_00775 [Lachnospiraceae bacterium]|nr:hypothetical protein [Lachnospiraceae bacterium]
MSEEQFVIYDKKIYQINELTNCIDENIVLYTKKSKEEFLLKKHVTVSEIEFAAYESYLLDVIDKKVAEKKLDVSKVRTQQLFAETDTLLELQKRFGLEPFRTEDGYLLPPASDFGVFSMMANKKNSCDLVRFYEYTHCFRKEEEVIGMKRRKVFHLPDFHSFLKTQKIELEFKEMLQFHYEILSSLEIPFFFAIRITKEEYKKYENFLMKISVSMNMPIVVNVYDRTIRYWEAKMKYIYLDRNKNFIQLATVQIDYSSPILFLMEGVDCIIHSTPGSIERLIYVLKDIEFKLK